ncbi:hypothetical protein OROGR_012232 [Orobanche gracilis]
MPPDRCLTSQPLASATAAGVNKTNANIGKSVKAVLQKKDSSSVAISEKKDGDRQLDKDTKKDVPHRRRELRRQRNGL